MSSGLLQGTKWSMSSLNTNSTGAFTNIFLAKSAFAAGTSESNRHLVMWEYESLAAYESYKARRKDYAGPYKEYKENDPYHKGVFIHSLMGMEFWKDRERGLWIE